MANNKNFIDVEEEEPVQQAEEPQLQKTPGLDEFVPNAVAQKLPRNSKNLAQVFRNTEKSLRQVIEESQKENGSVDRAAENNLRTFYDSVSNRYNVPVKTRQDFLDLMETVEHTDELVEEVRQDIEKDGKKMVRNTTVTKQAQDEAEAFIDKIRQEYQDLSSGSICIVEDNPLNKINIAKSDGKSITRVDKNTDDKSIGVDTDDIDQDIDIGS